MKLKELLTLIFYFSFIFLVALLTQDDFVNNPALSDNLLLNSIIQYKVFFFIIFPLVGSMLITDVSSMLGIIKPYRDLIYTLGTSIILTITYVLLLNSPHVTWAIIVAITSGLILFLLHMKRPDLLFVNDAHYLLNYEIIKKVIFVSTFLLIVSSLISFGKSDITNPYLNNPIITFLVQLIQFSGTIILIIEVESIY